MKFYENSLLNRREKKKHRIKVTFGNCVFLSGGSLNDCFSTREIKFKIGDVVTFLNLSVTITDVMLDEENRIIYRIESNSGLFTTSVQQEILLFELEKKSKNEIALEEELEEEKDEFGAEEIVQEEVDPKILVDTFAPKVAVTVRPIDYISQLGNSRNFTPTSLNFSEEPTIEDMIKFLKLESYSNNIAILVNIMKVYKFLVQNSIFDMTILKDKGTLNLADIDRFPDSFVLSFAFQHLLSKVGISSDIVMLKNEETKEKRATVAISVGKDEFFFDVAGERFLQENHFPTISSDVSMSYLIKEDYEPYFQPLGILNEEERKIVPSAFSRIPKQSIESMIIKGVNRAVGDMTYPIEKKK